MADHTLPTPPDPVWQKMPKPSFNGPIVDIGWEAYVQPWADNRHRNCPIRGPETFDSRDRCASLGRVHSSLKLTGESLTYSHAI